MSIKKGNKKGRNAECVQTRSRAEEVAGHSGEETHYSDGQVDPNPAGHSAVDEQSGDRLKDIVRNEITKALLTDSVIDQIVDSVYETVCKRLEGKISQNVHDGLNLELESKKKELKDDRPPPPPPPHSVLFRVRICLFPPFESTPLSPD